MQRLFSLILFFLVAASAYSSTVTDIYRFTMTLSVPHVVNNSYSLGRRVYQTQKFYGELVVEYNGSGSPDVSITSLTNRTFKVAGKPVTYSVFVDSIVWNLIGNNASGKFYRPTVYVSAEAYPSYVAAYIPTDDNSLIISMSGTGSSNKRMRGKVAGTLGCGCSNYGHVSPTRVMGAYGPLPIVHDVGAVFGTWCAVRKRRVCADDESAEK